MGKIFGKKEKFLPILDRGETNYLISYELKEGEKKDSWNEIVVYKKIYGIPTSVKDIKNFIWEDIDSLTDEKILNGFVWNDKPVWLSAESQRNFSEAWHIAESKNGANLPIKFKLGEIDGNPVYHTFTSMLELENFYFCAVTYIHQCLEEGWQRKDSIDWKIYEDALLEIYPIEE